MRTFFTGIIFFVWALVYAGFAQQPHKYWVYFSDKGIANHANIAKLARHSLSERAIKRRILRGEPGKSFEFSDLPVNNEYIQTIQNLGFPVINRSRWLNAVSISADPNQLNLIRQVDFVKKIEPVLSFIRKEPAEDEMGLQKPAAPSFQSSFDYGASASQIQQLNIPPLHDAGLDGSGVLVALIDTGFNYQLHRAFQHLTVVAERDFINHDNVTRSEEGQDSPGQDNHGTEILSIIAGYYPGTIIGPAFGASYALAKTEYIPSETRIEEDNWVAAAEWADSLGADIISTSLGYLDFDNGFTYTYDQLNGQTMVTSIAASQAVAKGIVVVTSAGNQANDPNYPDYPYITSPADGIGVIAVGAVNSSGTRGYFSSIGPTADGRIKPDVMAQGVFTVIVDPDDSTRITYGQGTSLSAPLIAGVCALLLQKSPQLTPLEVGTVLRQTASRALHPDNLYGWGIANAYMAALASEYSKPDNSPDTYFLHPVLTDLQNTTSYFIFDLPKTSELTISIYNTLGQKIEDSQAMLLAGYGRVFAWRWLPDAASGIYFARIHVSNKEFVRKVMIIR